MNDQAMLLPYHLYFVVTQIPNPKLDLEAGIALVLIAFVFVVSLAGIIIRGRMRRMRKW
jgi:ABC-type phosphate transport system permease subunit